MKNILGLDLGTNSIGWSLVNSDFESKIGNIVDLGSRIIPMDQGILGDFDKGNSVSQTAARTGYRSMRRLHERHILRRERLHRVLNILGYLPKHYAMQIDFEKHYGQFINNSEPKLPYILNTVNNKVEFIFQNSFAEMLNDFNSQQPQLITNNKKVPYDWTIYYLRKKALFHKIEKEELAWLLLNFNQKRGYYQLRGEDEEENISKLVEFHSLLVVNVEASSEKKGDETWYNVHLENGWIYRRTSKVPLDWKGKTKEFIVTTDLDEEGKIKIDKYGKEKRSFRSPSADDWTLLKKKTEFDIDRSNKTVGWYIYDNLLQSPNQKIKGKLVRTIERKFYKKELEQILIKQKEFHPELNSSSLYNKCLKELYENNEAHRNNIEKKDFTHLFLNDILFYQRPLKSKKHLISNCRYEAKTFVKDGQIITKPIKCIAKSHPLFQEFRLWQFLKDIRIYKREKIVNGRLLTDVDVTSDFLKNDNDWTDLFDWLNEKKEIDQKAFLKYPPFNLKKDFESYRWNYVEDKIYPCNETHFSIISRLKKVENIPAGFLSAEKEETLWHILYSVEDKLEIEKALKTFACKNALGEDFTTVFKKFPPFKKDYGSYSAKAIKKLLPLMRVGKYWSENAIDVNTKDRIGKIITGEYDESIKTRVREKAVHLENISDFQNLDRWLACYIVYNRSSELGDVIKWNSPSDIDKFLSEDFKQHSLRNPIVEQVITETLRVVRDIWIHYGNSETDFFDEIHIELGREMKNPADKRKKITAQVTENENTNLRIKALLLELFNDKEVENVRPNSPNQMEILKIYEEGILNSEIEIPEEILKIAKLAQPSASQLNRYKLWLQQKYRSPYTGEVIPLNKLFTRHYEIEHIIPKARYFDDSLSNKVICEAEVNYDKGKPGANFTAYEYIKNSGGKIIELSGNKKANILTIEAYENFVKTHFTKNRSKMKKLLMDGIPDKMIERQLNDTRYISKYVKNLLSNIVREQNESDVTSKNVIAGNGSITAILRQDWGLNDIWNQIITPRFERLNDITKSKNFGEWTNKEGKNVFQPQVPFEFSKGFSKKRIDHRHHALDALVIACATRNHIAYLNNEYAKSDKEKTRYDLRHSLCLKKYNDNSKENYKWQFYKPWETFTQDSRMSLNNTVISFKQNLRVINKTVNWYQKWHKDDKGNLKKIIVKQIKGDNWAIRKPLHKETVFGSVNLKFKKYVSLSVALENCDMIVDVNLKTYFKNLVAQTPDKKKLVKLLKETGNNWNGLNISKVEIYYWDDENVAVRTSLDDSFNRSKIESITDLGIQKILLNHLGKYDENVNNKVIEHPEIAFSPDGIDELNKNITELNDGIPHKPILKVRISEPKGNKFRVGYTGNKKDKFVEAAKGTNLFFAVYVDEDNKRFYDSIPLNIVIERLKQGLSPVPEINDLGYKLLFHLSPNDLVFVPLDNSDSNIRVDYFRPLTPEINRNIYKVVSFTGNQCFFVRNDIASPIINKFEFSPLNKMEKSLDGIMIKEYCLKIQSNRLGQIINVTNS